MKTIIFLIFLTSSVFSQTSRFTKFFQDTSGAPVTGSTIVLIPEGSAFPNDSLTMIEFPNRPGMYYRVGVPDGEYSLYIDTQFYISDIYIGEVRLTDDLNDYITKRNGFEFILEDDGRYLANKAQANVIAQLTFNAGPYGFAFVGNGGVLMVPGVVDPDTLTSTNLARKSSNSSLYLGPNLIPTETQVDAQIASNLAKTIEVKNEPLDTLLLSNSSILEQLTLTGDGTIFIQADSVNIKTLQVFTPGSDKIVTLKSNVTTIIAPTGNFAGSTGVSVQVDDAWYTFTIQYKSATEIGVTWVKVGDL